MSRTIAVVTAGLGQPSSTRLLSDRLAEATRRALALRGVETPLEVVELREHAHDLTNALLTGFPSARLAETLAAVTRADALIAVTPIFNASYSGLFKTFFDILESDVLAGKPVLIGATGGTVRHSLALELALRPLFTYLRAVVVPTSVFAATEDFGGTGSVGASLTERVERAAGELAALAAASAASVAEQPDGFPDPVDFSRLLAG
jgi:FMN reductase